MTIFKTLTYQFPYKDLKFPGQHTEEKILFACREGRRMLQLRWTAIAISAFSLLYLRAIAINNIIKPYLSQFSFFISLISFIFIISFTIISLWWSYQLWQKSIFIITNRRLTKFIYTTPWNRYQLSLGLDKIVDTGAYQKGFIQALSKYGYLVARSSAGNIKNFFILNISFYEDLHNYVNKLLYTFNRQPSKLDNFRPFIPHLKGEARKKFIKSVAPEYL